MMIPRKIVSAALLMLAACATPQQLTYSHYYTSCAAKYRQHDTLERCTMVAMNACATFGCVH